MFESGASNPAVSTKSVLPEEMSEIPWRRAAAAPGVRSDCGSRLRTTHRPLLAAIRGCHLMLERRCRRLARLRPLRFDGQDRVTALLRSVQHEACGTRQEGRSRLGLCPDCLRSGLPESHPQRCINRSHNQGVCGSRVFVRKGHASQRVNAVARGFLALTPESCVVRDLHPHIRRND